MPVVRELINRISFKINPADKANTEKAFAGMKLSAKGVLTYIAGLTTAGTKLFADFEKDTGASRFFARNAEEAESLLVMMEKLAGKSEIISRREAIRAAKTLQQTRLMESQISKFIPFLEKIDIARPDLDFTAVAESFRDVISGGDLQQLIEIIPGFKDAAELLSKTTFGKPFGDITDVQRGEIVLDALKKNGDRLNELVAEQQGTLVFQMEGLSKVTSDFTLEFGEKTAPAITELLKEIRLTIQALNDSASFWQVVKATLEGISEALRYSREITGIFSDIFGGDFSSFSKKQEEFEQRKTESGYRNPLQQITDFAGITDNPATSQNEQTITLGGVVKVVNEAGVELTQIGEDLTTKIMTELGTAFKNITAANGGVVTP